MNDRSARNVRWARLWAAAASVALVPLAFAASLFLQAPSASAYGPTYSITASCSIVGDRVTCTVSGVGFDPDTPITLTIHSTPVDLTTVDSNASGDFGPVSVTLPCGLGAGEHTFLATDTEGQSASAEVTVGAVPGCELTTGVGVIASTPGSSSSATGLPAATTAAASSGSSSLAFTGADVTLTITLAAALIALGGLLVTTSRKRRRQDWPSAGA